MTHKLNHLIKRKKIIEHDYEETLDSVLELLMNQKGCEIVLVGDFNARTGNENDTITPDKSDELFDINFTTPPPARNSRDTDMDQRGKDILDVCKSADLRIINGRKTGD